MSEIAFKNVNNLIIFLILCMKTKNVSYVFCMNKCY